MTRLSNLYQTTYSRACRPVDQLFTRIGTSDSIETNSSSFMVEMQETAYIASRATSRCRMIPLTIDLQALCALAEQRLSSDGMLAA